MLFADSPSPVNSPHDSNSNVNIKVVCRFRPQNSLEIERGGKEGVSFDDEMTSVQMTNSKLVDSTFSFDRIFDKTCSQADLFNYSAASIVQDTIRGYNGTIFAYGQTGTISNLHQEAERRTR